ncbi:radical SAM protein [Candidatus Roizmanbacteria bacterium]|nr:radical SAM protein [Candidatus Roizmanbacteria bacterium]
MHTNSKLNELFVKASPNVLITNHCNQSCPSCFAKNIMKDKSVSQEMSIPDLKILIKKLRGYGVGFIKIFGGEPTLHSKLEEVIRLCLANFSYIQLFTNGIFSKEVKELLIKYCARIRFTFNMLTPMVLYNKKIRNEFIQQALFFSRQTKITLSFTLLQTFDIANIVNMFAEVIPHAYEVRIGASNPLKGGINYYTTGQYRSLGSKVMEFIHAIRMKNNKLNVFLDCGYVRCMFSNSQVDELTRLGANKESWGCPVGTFDIQTNLKAISCYPLSNDKVVDIKKKDYWSKLIFHQLSLQKEHLPSMCKTCPHHGYEKDKCTGPCIAFGMNLKERAPGQALGNSIH